MKVVVFLGDGMADEPLPLLGGKTPLQAADTPNMDRIARNGRSGTFLTLPPGVPTSSDVANMSVLGCDLATEMCGRGPLEAASQGIKLGTSDVCFRVNLVVVGRDGVLEDSAGAHLQQWEAEDSIAMLNEHLGCEKIRFYPGVSYRNLLVLSGPEFSPVGYDKPDDNHGQLVTRHLPYPTAPGESYTVTVLRGILSRAAEVLKDREANGIWAWSGGRAGAIHSITERYGIKAAVISAVDVIKGLGACLGMDVINVPGATGYIDTNYEGKADAAIEALKTHDFVFVHVEAPDECSHARDAALKQKVIEDFDKRLIGRVMEACGDAVTYAVLPDHPVPIRTGRHTREPVPVSVWQPGVEPDSVDVYDEVSCRSGSLGQMKGSELMDLLLKEKK